MTREKQMKKIAKRVEKEVREETNENEREHYLAVWSGFLTGMRMTNAISKTDYDFYYQQLRDLVRELSERERTGWKIAI